jgi:hypothetical protein
MKTLPVMASSNQQKTKPEMFHEVVKKWTYSSHDTAQWTFIKNVGTNEN